MKVIYVIKYNFIFSSSYSEEQVKFMGDVFYLIIEYSPHDHLNM